MSAKHKGLGRGLGALIEEEAAPQPAAGETGVQQVAVQAIRLNPWQPRHEMDPEALQDLVRSVRDCGVLQPLLVRPMDDGYQLIAGERRLMAAREAGLERVPVVVRAVSDAEALELALVENLQREDLNPIEEADGYRRLMDEFELTQEQAAQRVGKSRAGVANALRLLQLPDPVREMVANGQLSSGHAKVLLGLPIPDEQKLFARRAVDEGLSVRALEKAVAAQRKRPRRRRSARVDLPENHLHYLENKLHQHFGAPVRLRPSRTMANGRKAKGMLQIDFFSNEELDRLLEILGMHENL